MTLHAQGYCMSALALIGAGFGLLERNGFLMALSLIVSFVCFGIATAEQDKHRRDVERLRGGR